MSDTGIPDDLRDAVARTVTVSRLLVSSDYDGCIAPIVSRPQDAKPNEASISAIRAAGALRDTEAAVISGRSLHDLRALSGLDDDAVTLVGSHGTEFTTGFGEQVTDDERALLDRIVKAFNEIADTHPGTTVEVKPISAALHVRNAEPDVADDALAQARSGPASWPGVQVTEGKMVIELAVIETSKGHALDILETQFGSDATVYIGDDVTDEKAFAHLTGENDISVKVGDGDTGARYRIADTDDVATLLALVVELRKQAL